MFLIDTQHRGIDTKGGHTSDIFRMYGTYACV